MTVMFEDETIKCLRKYYFEAILKLQFENEILKALPEISHDSFFPIIDGLIEEISKDIEDLEEISSTVGLSSEESEDLKLSYLKKNLCEQRRKEALEILEEEVSVLNSDGKKNLIFAFTDSGNVYFEKDLKEIPEEYYQVVIDNLYELENGNIGKNFKSNNKLSGLRELCPFKVRLIFRVLDYDTIYVMMVRMKKDNCSRDDVKQPEIRSNNTNDQFLKLKKLFRDPKFKKEYVLKNEGIKENLINYLTINKRGDKRGR